MIRMIERLLRKRLDKKKQDVIRLRWQKAELEQKLADMKRMENHDGH